MKSEMQDYRPIPFFFLNTTDTDALSLASARETMRRMKEAGYGGALLFNKPPTGFDAQSYLSEAWYKALEHFCIAAKEENLRIWINDGWDYPPGDAGGRILQVAPELTQYHLEEDEKGTIRPVKTEWGFPAFEEPRSSELFHRFVYEGLLSHLGQYFGDPIEGIFSDADNRRINAFTQKELPSKVYFPWSPTLPEQFRARYGYDLEAHVKEIFSLADVQASSDYWMLVSELYQKWFAANYRWCRAHNLRYSFHTSDTGPLPPEICRRSSAFSEGESLKMARNCDYPGTDHELFALDGGTHYDGRFFVPEVNRGGDLARWHHPAFSKTFYDLRAKITASAAFLYGKKRALCEAFAATNWEATPEKLRRIAAWQIMQGINFFIPHAVHVRLFGSTKFFAPPEFLHTFPTAALREFNGFLAKYSMIAAQGEYRPQLAVLDPTPELWRGKTPGKFFELCDKLNRMAVDYVITDIEHAKMFSAVIDPLCDETPELPEPYARFTGGELAYFRRFMPDGSSFFLAANLWSETTLCGKLVTENRTISLELAPGEIAVIGGKYEEFRTPRKIDRSVELPASWRVSWSNFQRIGFLRSFSWENRETLSKLTLLVPGNGEAKADGKILHGGKTVRIFDDLYTEYVLPEAPGIHRAEFSDAEFHTPVYLAGDFAVEYTSQGDRHTIAAEFYNLRIFFPETESIKLSRRPSSLHSGSWTDQGAPFYSGSVEYECEIDLEQPMDEVELLIEGCCCEVAADGVSLGKKALPPYCFPVKTLAPGKHQFKVTVTNTPANQIEGFRVPSGLMGGKLLKFQK